MYKNAKNAEITKKFQPEVLSAQNLRRTNWKDTTHPPIRIKGEFSIEPCIGLVKIAPSVYKSIQIY